MNARFNRLIHDALCIAVWLMFPMGCASRPSDIEGSVMVSDDAPTEAFFEDVEKELAGGQPLARQGPEGARPGDGSSSPFDLDFESAGLKGIGVARTEQADPSKYWIPPRFREVRDGLAMRWLEPSQQACKGKACVPAEVISRDGCSQLYLSVTFLDGDRNSVSHADITEKNLKPFVKKVFTFRDRSGGRGRKVSLEESICR